MRGKQCYVPFRAPYMSLDMIHLDKKHSSVISAKAFKIFLVIKYNYVCLVFRGKHYYFGIKNG